MKRIFLLTVLIIISCPIALAKGGRTPAQENEVRTKQTPADSQVGTVSQLLRDSQRAVVQIATGVSVGDLKSLVVTTGPGEACEASVISIKNDQILIQFSKCSTYDNLKAGAAANRNLFEEDSPSTQASQNEVVVAAQPDEQKVEPSAPPATTENDYKAHFTLAVGYHNGTKLNYDDMTYTTGGTTYTGEYSFQLDSAVHVAAGVIFAPKYHWGFYGGISRESKRTLKSETASIDGGGTATVVYSAGKPTVTFTLVEINALYRWNQFYIPFGFNVSIVDFTTGGVASTTTVEASGAAGAQVGVGFFANEKTRFEFYSQVISNELKISTPTEQLDLKTGTIAGAAARVAVDF